MHVWVSSWCFYFAFPDEQRRCGPCVTPAPGTDWAQSRCSVFVESAHILHALHEPPSIWTLQRNHEADIFRNQTGKLERNKTIPYLEALLLKQRPYFCIFLPRDLPWGFLPECFTIPWTVRSLRTIPVQWPREGKWLFTFITSSPWQHS